MLRWGWEDTSYGFFVVILYDGENGQCGPNEMWNNKVNECVLKTAGAFTPVQMDSMCVGWLLLLLLLLSFCFALLLVSRKNREIVFIRPYKETNKDKQSKKTNKDKQSTRSMFIYFFIASCHCLFVWAQMLTTMGLEFTRRFFFVIRYFDSYGTNWILMPNN